MTPLSVAATRLLDGKEIALADLTDLSVTATLDSPARSMTCTAAVDAFPGALGAVTVRWGERVLFTGKVDKQAASLSENGRLLTIDARSRGAELLDNEAAPCTLGNVRLAAVFRLFIAPYDFVLVGPDARRTLAVYTVHKGCSEWEALTGYCRRAYGKTPHVVGDMVMLDRPRSAAPLVIGGAGLPFSRLEQVIEPYRMLSKVVLRDGEGHYSSAVHNSAAAYYGVRRKRYVIPPGEFADSAALDANQRIRRSMLEAESVTAVLPGIHLVEIGREAVVEDVALRQQNLLAREVTWRQSRAGLTTELALCSSVYYE